MAKPPHSRPLFGCGAVLIALASLPVRGAASEDLAASIWQSSPAGHAVAPRQWYCRGSYIEPSMPLPRDADSDAYGIEASAGDLQARIGAAAVLSGGVTIRQGNRLLAADELRIDEAAGIATSAGPLRLAEPGMHILGKRATVGLAGATAYAEDAQFVDADLHLRGSAGRIQRNRDTLLLDDTFLTRCSPGDDLWRLQAAQLRIDRNTAVVSARHARLALGGVPVFYMPYARFPVRGQRASGFLFPDLGYDDDGGLDVALPYYLNLARNYDATVTGRLLSERGVGVQGEIRHRSRDTRTELTGALLPADDKYDGRFPRGHFAGAAHGDDSAFAPADRWLAGATHRGRIGRYATSLDYAAVSDNDYFADFGSTLESISRVALERRAEARFASGALVARVWAQSFQRLEPGATPHRRLPAADIRYGGKVVGPLSWSLDASWSAFEATTSATVGGTRLHLAPRLRLPLAKSWGSFTVAAGAYRTDYDLDRAVGGAGDRQRRNIRYADADAKMFFERTGAGGTTVQTLEPRIRYVYRSYAAQDHLPRFDTVALTSAYRQLFSDRRYAGIDRIGDANQITIGVTSRRIHAASGRERLAAGLGVVTHLKRRRVLLDDATERRPGTALVAGELSTGFGATDLAASIAWSAEHRTVDEAGLGISYSPDQRRIVNFGYRRRVLAGVDQTDVSLHWPLAKGWSAFARWNHDWRIGQTIDSFAGVGYESCCLAVKVLWHATVDAPRNGPRHAAGKDRGVLVQVVLRGLAGFGTKIDTRLERGIKGYRKEEDSR